MTIYLYLKTHNVTGMKYLGKTVRDPFTYNGSGLYWQRHLKKHGCDISTEILFETSDQKQFNKISKKYSQKFNVVESKLFANLCHEEGQGGHTLYSSKRNQAISEKLTGKTKTKEHRKKISITAAGMTTAMDLRTGKNVRVSKEEFNANREHYKGLGGRKKT